MSLYTYIKQNGGATLKGGKPVEYKTGWQVATTDNQRRSWKGAKALIERMGGTCGVWYSEGIYYIDDSRRVKTKREAIEIGAAHGQKSILKWQTKELVYLA